MTLPFSTRGVCVVAIQCLPLILGLCPQPLTSLSTRRRLYASNSLHGTELSESMQNGFHHQTAFSSPNPPFLGSVPGVVSTPNVHPSSNSDHWTTTANGNSIDTDNVAVAEIAPSANATAPASMGGSVSSPLEIKEGIYQLTSEEDYEQVLADHPNQLVVIKFYANYCRACQQLKPKLLAVKDDPQLQGLPIVWAEFAAVRTSKHLFRHLRVLTLPTIQFYDQGGLVENFSCPPNRIRLLKKKLARFLNARVDPANTHLLKPLPPTTEGDGTHPTGSTSSTMSPPAPSEALPTSTIGGPTDISDDEVTAPRVTRPIIIDNELVTLEHIQHLRSGMPFFKDLTDAEFEEMLAKARLLTFNRGDVIVRQGMMGNTFYVVKSGIIEMHIKSRFDDPISTPSQYLGIEVGNLKKFDFFGERALTTGEPLSASFRVLEKARCFAFHVDDIPESSILSKKRRASQEFVEQLNERYILPEDYTPDYYPTTPRDECILELLVRFQQIRQAAKCFDYVMGIAAPTWGDAGEIARRNLLARKLSKSLTSEFHEVFDMVDVQRQGAISLEDLRRFMMSARQSKTDKELATFMDRATGLERQATPSLSISRDEFIGVMAEAEFYNLFKETFQVLDSDNTGYVRAGDLDEILGGVRNLIMEGDKASIIDVENADLLVDYEQFSKMLLGAAL